MKTDITQMKLNHTYKYILALMLLLFSCQKNEMAPTETITDAITFSVSSNGGYSASTRAGEDPMALISDDGKDTLVMMLSDISDISGTPDTTLTKGVPVTSSNLKSFGEKIAIRAFYENEQFINDVFVFDQNGNARTSIACYWPAAENAMVNFWSFHPKEIAQAQNYIISNDASSPSLSFYYLYSIF